MIHYPKDPPPREFVGSVTRQAFQAVKDSRKEGPLGRPRWSGWDKLLAALFIFVAAAVFVQTIRNCTLKANADFIATLSEKETYIPCRAEDLYTTFSVLNYNPLDKKEDVVIAREVYIQTAFSTDGQDFPDKARACGLRGGKLGSDRDEEFMTRGIRIGDSPEDLHRILGEPDYVLIPDKSEVYCFNNGISGQYRICVEYIDQKLWWIKLGYTDTLTENLV